MKTSILVLTLLISATNVLASECKLDYSTGRPIKACSLSQESITRLDRLRLEDTATHKTSSLSELEERVTELEYLIGE